MKRILFALLMLCTPQWAQDKVADVQTVQPKSDKPTERLLVMLKYANPAALANLISTYSNVSFHYNEEMKAITLSGPSDAVDAVVAMIKQLDVPPKDIELTIYYLLGSEGENNLGSAPPKELDPVVTQLRNAFTFKNYRLLDVLALRTRTGQTASTSSNLGSLQIGQNSVPIVGEFRIRSATVAIDGSTIRLDEMTDNLRWPVSQQGGNQWNYANIGLKTDVDIKEGQKVVVGRLGISHDQALFLVLTAKVVN
jgi:hypothetical protein